MNNPSSINANALKLVVKLAQANKATSNKNIAQQNNISKSQPTESSKKGMVSSSNIPVNTQGGDTGAPKSHVSVLRTSLFAMNYGEDGDSFGGSTGDNPGGGSGGHQQSQR